MLIRKMFVATMVTGLLLVGLVGGCSSDKPTIAPVPYIPIEYYDCLEAYPAELVATYFSGYGDVWGPMERYNDKVFVFKNVLIDDWVLQDLDEGLLWLSYIKCSIANISVMSNYKKGDRIDLVGYNLGPENISVKELTFKDCYVLPPGAIVLPAEGNGVIDGGY